MDATIRIDPNLKKLLKIRSVKLGVTQKDLANMYLFKCLKEDDAKSDDITVDEVARKMNLSPENKLNEYFKDKEDIIELVPERDPLTKEELHAIIDNSDQTSNVKFTDILGIYDSS